MATYFTPHVSSLASVRVKPEIFYPRLTPAEFDTYWQTGDLPEKFDNLWVPLTPPTFGELNI